MPRRTATAAASVAAEEIARFSRHAGDWWDRDGAFKPLHRLNPVRLAYVRDRACSHFERNSGSRRSLEGLAVLDVGCGGGLLAEPLARLGGRVTGLDASAAAIAEARRHAKAGGLDIDYRDGSAEDLANPLPQGERKKFDLITALEVAEHVADLDSFVTALARLLKPGGLLVMSTLNRTPKSFLLGIVAAEYVMGWVPRGTHQWNKFIRPSELARRLEQAGLGTIDLTGLVFNPLRGEFELRADDLAVNYMLTASRRASPR